MNTCRRCDEPIGDYRTWCSDECHEADRTHQDLKEQP